MEQMLESHPVDKKMEQLQAQMTRLESLSYYSAKAADESLFAHRLANAASCSSWFMRNDFSGYHAAADYAMLFGLYRVLDRLHPTSILELGAGETTKMIAQYIHGFPQARCLTIDNNPYWLEIVQRDFGLQKERHICKMVEVEPNSFEEHQITLYKNLAAVAQSHAPSYDLIIVDGGDSCDRYSRLSVLRCLHLLAEKFTIIIDDLDRAGEMELLHLVQLYFQKNNIPIHAKFIQENPSLRKQVIITSANHSGQWV